MILHKQQKQHIDTADFSVPRLILDALDAIHTVEAPAALQNGSIPLWDYTATTAAYHDLLRADLLRTHKTCTSNRTFSKTSIAGGHAYIFDDVVDDRECEILCAAFAQQEQRQVNAQGLYPSLENAGNLSGRGSGRGSYRALAWSSLLAAWLAARLAPYLFHAGLAKCTVTPYTPNDWFTPIPYTSWIWCGVSNLLRFMRYQDGEHWPHCDAGYDFGDSRRTLYSMILYLTDHPQPTRLLDDGQEHILAAQKNYTDWSSSWADSEKDQNGSVQTSRIKAHFDVYPKRGRVLCFDHRLLHDVPALDANLYQLNAHSSHAHSLARVVVRGDLVFYAPAAFTR